MTTADESEQTVAGSAPDESQSATPDGPEAPPEPQPQPAGRAWTAGKIVSVIVGSLLGLASFAVLAGGAGALWVDQTQRDSAGYVTSNSQTFSTAGYAIASDRVDLGGGAAVVTTSDVLGTVRVRATSTSERGAIFIGIAPQAAVDNYLATVDHAIATNWWSGRTKTYELSHKSSPAEAPVRADFWTVHSAGTGTQTVTWKPSGGNWAVVVMNADGSPGVSVTSDVGARLPWLGWLAAGLLVGGGLLLVFATALVVVPVVRAGR